MTRTNRHPEAADCPFRLATDQRYLIYAKPRTRGLLADIWEHDDENRPRVWFATVDKLKQSGLLAKEIWEDA